MKTAFDTGSAGLLGAQAVGLLQAVLARRSRHTTHITRNRAAEGRLPLPATGA